MLKRERRRGSGIYTEDGAKRDFHFLFGTSGYPIRSPKLWGLCRLSNEVSGGLCP
jgi:hypothetical protein